MTRRVHDIIRDIKTSWSYIQDAFTELTQIIDSQDARINELNAEIRELERQF